MANVAIIGGGIGGLTLANALKKVDPKISFKVFERDRDIQSRKQGYALGLNGAGGLLVLKRLGLYDQIQKLARPATDFSFLTSGGKRLMTFRPVPNTQYFTLGVPRGLLRLALLESLNKDNVVFNKRAIGYRENQERPVVLFEDGSEEAADLIVACDGVNSLLRKQMSGDQANFLGLTGIAGTVKYSISHPLLDGGSFMTFGPGTSVFVQGYDQEGGAIWSMTKHGQPKEFDGVGQSKLKELALAETKGWHSPIQELIRNTLPENIRIRGYYDKEPLKSAHQGRVVLLGDAAHPMSPFRGQGANMAMVDAIDIADLLAARSPNDWGVAILSYEKKMLERTKPHVLRSRKSAYQFHSTSKFKSAMRNFSFKVLGKLMSLAPQPQNNTESPP